MGDAIPVTQAWKKDGTLSRYMVQHGLKHTRQRSLIIDTFFATWCFPCLGQLALLQSMQKKYADRGLEVVAIGMDLEGWTVLEPFQREYQLSFPILLPSQAVREGKSAFGQISTLPASFVFGRDGQLLSVFGGLPTAEELDRLIANAVKT